MSTRVSTLRVQCARAFTQNIINTLEFKIRALKTYSHTQCTYIYDKRRNAQLFAAAIAAAIVAASYQCRSILLVVVPSLFFRNIAFIITTSWIHFTAFNLCVARIHLN